MQACLLPEDFVTMRQIQRDRGGSDARRDKGWYVLSFLIILLARVTMFSASLVYYELQDDLLHLGNSNSCHK